MLTYASIDIETTGLDPQQNQMLQISAVVDNDRSIPIGQLPSYTTIIKWDMIVGNPVALAMNTKLIERISNGEGLPPQQAIEGLRDFLKPFATPKIVAAGKNFGSFDRQFLKITGIDPMFHYRSLDPAMLYLLPEDTVPPSLSECLKRAGMPSEVTHNALVDAQQVIALLRNKGI